MKQGGQNDNDDEDELLRLVAVEASAQECANETSRPACYNNIITDGRGWFNMSAGKITAVGANIAEKAAMIRFDQR